MPPRSPWATNPNQSPVDQYTLLHLGAGMFFRKLGVPFLCAVALSLLWEKWIEPQWKVARPDIFPAPSQDTPINSFFDTAAVGAGWYLEKRRRHA